MLLARSEPKVDSVEPVPVKRAKVKNLEVQRAFRARKAAHVADLEREVALLRIEVSQLRAENAELRATSVTPARAESRVVAEEARACSGSPDDNGAPPVEDMQMASLEQCCAADVLCELGQLPVLRPAVLPQSTLPPVPSRAISSQTTYTDETEQQSTDITTLAAKPNEFREHTHSRPPVNIMDNNPPRFPLHEHTGAHLSSALQGPVEQIAETPIDTNSKSTSLEGLPQPTTAEVTTIPTIECCNSMFPCEDDAEARWIKVNTGVRGIGTGSVDDFYSLFASKNTL